MCLQTCFSMRKDVSEQRARAEELFKPPIRAAEGMREYRAAQQELLQRTRKLRKARLAREASQSANRGCGKC
jgi:DNA-binding transcriptional MerR regulator